MANGAPCLSISIDGREFQCTGDGTATPIQGGYSGEHNPNGNPSTGRWIYTPKGWSFPGQTIDISYSNGDMEYIDEKISSMQDLDIVATYIDHQISGRGRIEGDVEEQKESGTASISFKGSGKYTRKEI